MDPEPARDSDPDEVLLRRIRDAVDEQAFGALFERHAHVLAARVRSILPAGVQRKTSVADVLQETRITALRRCPEFELRDGIGLRAWLLKIAEMKARAAYRRFAGTAKRAAGREVTRGGRASTGAFAARGPTPSEHAMAAETRDAVLSTMAALPPDYAEVLHLTRIEGLTLGEAARRMGRSREAVKKLYGRAMVQFTAAYGPQARRDA